MTRVTNEDLEWLVGYCDGDSSKAVRIAREMRAELLALRKVADAAATMVDSAAEDQLNWNVAWRTLVRALREAGL